MGDLTLAEVGRTLARIEASQADAAKQIAELAKTVHLVLHGPADQPVENPTGVLPRLMLAERYYKELKVKKSGWIDKTQAGIVSAIVTLLLYVVTNWEHVAEAAKKGHNP